MKVLTVAIETSSRPGSIALGVGTRVWDETLEGARAHASDLLPALERLRQEAGVPRGTDSNLRAVFVGTGPGSYTGLRVGLATARALAHAADAAILGVPSFDAVAYEGLGDGDSGCVISDARAGRFYYACYAKAENGELRVTREPCALELFELPGAIGDDVVLLEEKSAASLPLPTDCRERLRIVAVPSARTLLRIGQERLRRSGPSPSEELEPLYLMRFEAKPRKR